MARQQYIGQLELLAAVAAYTTFPDLLSSRKVIHWIDNTGALAALVKGYSRAPHSCRIVHAFHALNLGFQSRVWFEYVASEANIGDLPSRDEFELLHELRSEHRDLVLPDVARFDDDDAEAWAVSGLKLRHPQGPRHRSTQGGGEAGRPRRRRR